MPEVKTNVCRILDKNKIEYQSHSYEPGEKLDAVTAAHKMGRDPDQVFKTLVTQGKSGTFHVFVIPGARELDLKKAAKAAGEKSVEMIHVKDINKVTGYIRGGCSPIGMKKRYPTVIDESAKLQKTIVISAGRIGSQVELSPEDLAQLVQASFASITFQGEISDT